MRTGGRQWRRSNLIQDGGFDGPAGGSSSAGERRQTHNRFETEWPATKPVQARAWTASTDVRCPKRGKMHLNGNKSGSSKRIIEAIFVRMCRPGRKMKRLKNHLCAFRRAQHLRQVSLASALKHSQGFEHHDMHPYAFGTSVRGTSFPSCSRRQIEEAEAPRQALAHDGCGAAGNTPARGRRLRQARYTA